MGLCFKYLELLKNKTKQKKLTFTWWDWLTFDFPRLFFRSHCKRSPSLASYICQLKNILRLFLRKVYRKIHLWFCYPFPSRIVQNSEIRGNLNVLNILHKSVSGTKLFLGFISVLHEYNGIWNPLSPHYIVDKVQWLWSSPDSSFVSLLYVFVGVFGRDRSQRSLAFLSTQ